MPKSPKKRRDPCYNASSLSEPSRTRLNKTHRVSPTRPSLNRDKPAPKPVPNQLRRAHIQPRKVRTAESGEEESLWEKDLADNRVRQDVLRHVVRCTDHPFKKGYPEQRWHEIFSLEVDAQYRPASACITLRHGDGVATRSGERYTSIFLGHEKAGRKESWKKFVDIDAHHLVCWLTRGPPEGDKCYALHSEDCPNKTCVRPGHLSWGTQKENVRQWRAKQAASAKRRRGAPLRMRFCMGACVVWQGSACKPVGQIRGALRPESKLAMWPLRPFICRAVSMQHRS